MQKLRDGLHRIGGSKRIVHIVIAAVVLLATFNAGILVGNGSIQVGKMASQNGKLPGALDYASVNEVYQALKTNYDGKLTQQQLLDGLKVGLAEATDDPYTQYFNTSEAKKFNEQLTGSFSGIGAQLGQNDDKALVVVAPISGSPAEKAGLKAGDIITGINGKTTTGMSIDEAVSRIRGTKGTDVTLAIVRDSSDMKLTITRDEITVPSVEYKILDDNIGYIQISQFSDDTIRLASDAAQKFKDADVDGIIVDLRDDPGGLLDAAVGVANLWLPKGQTILQEKRGGQVIQTYASETTNPPLKGIPTVALINNGSASAAEILAGALRDNNTATLMGEKSYGKGSVQQIQPFKDGSQLKVTIARWYRPNGQNIDKKGINPDKTVTLSEEQAKAGTDTQKDAALEFLKQQ
ncbi:MAG TPA: S41 family peptidase [Candidatus Saccharimonadales bacterium]|nr:S41 family peptidase [Candidatus Saccharimonadales bacterium]